MADALLIVDDEPNIVRALTRLFRDSGYEIFTATSGQDALQLLASHPIQVIISDHRMPQMTGSEFLTEVKRMYPDTVRMILSGYADFEIIKDAINEGLIYKFLTKPWEDGVLRQQIQDAFQTYKIQNKNKWDSQVLDHTLEGVVITDSNDVIIKVNQSYTTISGQTEAELIGNTFDLFKPQLQNPSKSKIKDQLNKTGSWGGELWIPGKKKIFPARTTITAIYDIHHKITQYTYIILDLSGQKEQEKIVEQQLYTDKITGLNNRLYFSNELGIALAKAQHTSTELDIICINLDRFGTLNQNLGFAEGNMVLQQIAIRLKHIAQEKLLLARIGNDEFALIMAKEKNDDLELLLNQILNMFKQPILIGHSNLYVSASIGVSCYPQHGENADFLINSACKAISVCKERGGNTFQLYNESMDNTDVTEFYLESELHQALENDEFVLFYQPIISAVNGKIISMEALIRWQHPNKGLLNPDQFLSLCETTALIIPLTYWILLQACEQVKAFHNLGFTELFVAVNLSTRQFNDPHLLNIIKDILEKTKIPPHCLEIEITESLSMQRIDENAKLLKKLRKLGIQLALDDFGTGYSSMSYLKQLPFNILKIDKSFIQDITMLSSSLAIVQAIVTLGKSLGMMLIAEGVETKEQLNILQEIHCDLIQGYLFSKPLPASQFKELLLQNPKN